jgi:hypothetical protein
VDLKILAQEIDARPAGKIDGLLAEQIALIRQARSELRRITERLELQQRKCGSMPTGPCRSGYEYLKTRRDDYAGRLRMDQLKIEALIAQRRETLRQQDTSGITGKVPATRKQNMPVRLP